MISTLLKDIAFYCIEQIFENSPIKLDLDYIKIVNINPKLFSNRPLDRKHSQLCKSASWCIVVWIQGIVKWVWQWNRQFCLARVRAEVLVSWHEPIEKVLSGSWNVPCSSLPNFESIRSFLEWLRRRGSISRGPSTSQFWIKSLSTRLSEKFLRRRILNLNFPFFVFMMENVVYNVRYNL